MKCVCTNEKKNSSVDCLEWKGMQREVRKLSLICDPQEEKYEINWQGKK